MNKIHLSMLLTGVAVATNAVGQANNGFLLPVSAPTLGEVGLGLLVVLLAAVGGFFARRKK